MTTPVIIYAQPDPQAGPRPATVTVAVWLQSAVVLLAASLIPAIWYMHARWTRLIDEALLTTPGADQDIAAAERDSSLYAAIAMTVVAALVVLWFGGTLPPLWRGSNLARVLAAVGSGLLGVGGFVMNCCGLAFLPLLFLLPFEPMDPGMDPGLDPGLDPAAPVPDDPFFDEDPFTERLYQLSDRDVAWLEWLVPLAGGLALLLLVGVFVLLLVPPSNRWFAPRPPQPFSGHPYPGYGYPAYPHPGYPHSAAPAPPAEAKQPPTPF
ncbi:hypothetical protein CS0771_14190 [Catellatospora sp. IY07-71]|uniref:hypothetical protein n=1 Tax=Catellatospora sp. IY07-71 TaxID=2728827 RepID=UPI001BB320E5|nr:hypothetical protein [Catellatospora sp. IY07-71]BCJ71875.1 hypothetical protein CS0771_14190 [Catellatospora sp. IY07-71]